MESCITFLTWSLSILFSRFIHVVPFILRLNNNLLSVDTTFRQSILLTDTWVASTFWPLWLILPWTWVYKFFFWDPTFNFFKYIPRSGNGGSYGNSMKNCRAVFHNGYAILHSHQQDQFVHILTNAYFLFFW